MRTIKQDDTSFEGCLRERPTIDLSWMDSRREAAGARRVRWLPLYKNTVGGPASLTDNPSTDDGSSGTDPIMRLFGLRTVRSGDGGCCRPGQPGLQMESSAEEGPP